MADADGAAYRTGVLTSIGAYDIFVPPRPKETKDPKAAMLQKAIWTMGMNPTYSMRKADKAVESFKKLI